jgi:hypothetical protein
VTPSLYAEGVNYFPRSPLFALCSRLFAAFLFLLFALCSSLSPLCCLPYLLLLTCPAIHYSLFTIHYSLFTIHYSLFTIHYSLFTIHYSLFTIHLLYFRSTVQQFHANRACPLFISQLPSSRVQDKYSCI